MLSRDVLKTNMHTNKVQTMVSSLEKLLDNEKVESRAKLMRMPELENKVMKTRLDPLNLASTQNILKEKDK